MYFRNLAAPAVTRKTCSAFPGLDRREGAAAGAAAEMENLWSGAWPALQTRQRRGLAATLADPQGLAAGETLVWVDGRVLYVAGQATGLVLTEGEKQFVTMGAYLAIFPDKKWINLEDMTEFGSLENVTVTEGTAQLSLCRGDGTGFGAYAVGPTAPEQPEEGALWVDSSGQEPVLRRYDGQSWEEAAECCVKVQAAGIGVGFRQGDGVELSGCGSLDGRHVLRQVSDGAIVIDGTIAGEGSCSQPVTVARRVPEMDFVVECGNRLWGCRYGVAEGRTVNEIYGSKLGDMRNWNCFSGLSTDSYAAARGSEGVFTGAASYLGSALFFKENCVERVYPGATGGHRIVTLECPGVARGSGKSVARVEGKLYYLGRDGVYAFEGALPQPVSGALGEMALRGGTGGGREGRYYLSAREGERQHLLVYDTRRGLWHREDGLEVMDFAAWNGELYALAGDGRVWAMEGRSGEKEADFPWTVRTGELGLTEPRHKYALRLNLRLTLEPGATVQAAISYDGGRVWLDQGGTVGQGGTEAVTLQLRPRRCAQLMVRLQGRGRCTLHSASAVYEKGSDAT